MYMELPGKSMIVLNFGHLFEINDIILYIILYKIKKNWN